MDSNELEKSLIENVDLHHDLMSAVDLYPTEQEDYVTENFLNAMIESEDDREILVDLSVLTERDEEDGYEWTNFEETKSIVYQTPLSVPMVETKPFGKIPKILLGSMILLSPGIRYAPIRDTIAPAIDIFLGPIVESTSFFIALVLISFFTSFVSVIAQRKLKDVEKIKEIRKQIDLIQTEQYRLKQNGKHEEAVEFRNSFIFDENVFLKLPRELFRTMPIVLSASLPMFIWMIWSVNVVGVSDTIPLPLIDGVAWNDTFLFIIPAWIIVYFIISMCASIILKLAFRAIE